jgi:hypothetical protein
MRGRKHPLEVFRQSGRQFLTQRSEAERAGNREDEARRLARRASQRRSLRPASADGETEEGALAPPRRQPWDVRAGDADASRKAARARRALSMPLWRVGALLGGLVLLVGGAYALGLWPFALEGVDGETRSPLQRFQSIWRDPTVAPEPGAPVSGASERPATSATDRSEPRGGGEVVGARPQPEIEYWVVAASLKLTPDLKKGDAWRKRFEPDKERLQRALGDRFPGMKIQTCYGDKKREDVLLRAGCAASADDPALQKLLAAAKAPPANFKDAVIRAFKAR